MLLIIHSLIGLALLIALIKSWRKEIGELTFAAIACTLCLMIIGFGMLLS